MDFFRYKLKKGTKTQDFSWNMAGNLCSAAHSVLMLAYVSRFCGEYEAGVFSLTYSSAQMMYLVACFQMVNVLVTDAQGKLGIYDTVVFRAGTSVLMIMISAVFAGIQGFSGHTLYVFLLLTAYMFLLSLAELCECHFHRNGYLYMSGRSLASHMALSSMVFAVVLCFTKNLCAATVAMCCAVFLWLCYYDIPYLVRMYKNQSVTVISWDAVRYLFKMCTPLVCMQFIMNYIIHAPKFAINMYLTNHEQSFFGYIMMPAACVNLLNLFALKPQLINLTRALTQEDRKWFEKIVTGLLGWNGIVSICVLVGGYFLGIPILSAFYGVNLSQMRSPLCIVLLGGCAYAFAVLFDAVATTMRCHQWNLLIYIPTFLLSCVMPQYLVKASGLMGAAISYLLMMTLLAVGSAGILFVSIRKKFVYA